MDTYDRTTVPHSWFHTVYWLQPHLIPLPDRLALGGWQAFEEACIAYVAATRAKVWA